MSPARALVDCGFGIVRVQKTQDSYGEYGVSAHDSLRREAAHALLLGSAMPAHRGSKERHK
jgi:hypothetical protein